VAGRLGLDPDAVAGAVARSAEASRNAAYGIRGGAPFAGACLPKDTDGFLAFARELGLPMPLLASVVDVNRQLAQQVDVELDTLARSGGRVLDLRETERRAADQAATRAAARAAARATANGPAPRDPFTGDLTLDGAHVDLRYGSPDASGWYHGPAGPSRDAW
jgi:UDPglucose 6-dehydrogenase